MRVASLMALAIVAIGAGQCCAFHDGGVGACDGCHTIHNSAGGLSVTGRTPAGTGNRYLLVGSDPSSACLVCHGGGSPADTYKVATIPVPAAGIPPQQLTPGGDFAYLQKTYRWVVSTTGTPVTSPGDSHGHNIVAADFFYFPDPLNAVSPGGSYPSSALGCTSCHDPHGRYRVVDTSGTVTTGGKPTVSSGSSGALPTATTAVGVYRILGGIGYLPASLAGTAALSFVAPPPVAVAPPQYNRAENVSDVRVAYGSGMSEWCGNCHGAYQHTLVLTSPVAGHPSGGSAKLLGVADAYNAYIRSGVYTGSFATAYTSLVPFEDGTADVTILTAETAATTGAAPGDQLSCLTCHRAHASAWNHATRWNAIPGAFLTVAGAWPGTNAPTVDGQKGENATGKTVEEYQQGMGGRRAATFAPAQGSLCNKCHWNDTHKTLPE